MHGSIPGLPSAPVSESERIDATRVSAIPTRRDRVVAVGLFIAAYLYVFPYYPAINNPNENVRVYMTAAIVEEGGYEISTFRRRWGWTNDAACVQKPNPDPPPNAPPIEGAPTEPEPCERRAPGTVREYYSVKAPLMSWLGVPAYAFRHWRHGPTADLAETFWWMRATASGIPMAIFFWFFYGWLGRRTRYPMLRDTVYVGTALGSVLLGYAYLFVSHSLSAAAAFGAFMLLDRALDGQQRVPSERMSWLAAGFAGFLAAAASALEYPCFLITFALCLLALVAVRPWPRLVAFGLGALIPTLIVMHFQHVAYGNAFTPGHLFVENAGFRHQHESGLFGADEFRWSAAGRLLGDLRLGLFTTTPLFAFAPLGLGAMQRRSSAITMVFGVIALYVVICFMNNWTGGWSIGPRYLVAVIPFVSAGVLLGLDRLAQRRRELAHVLALGTTMSSLLISGVYSAYYPHLPETVHGPMTQLFPELIAEGFAPSNVAMLFGVKGTWSMVPFALLLLGALVWAGQWSRAWRRWSAALVIAALTFSPHVIFAPRRTPEVDHVVGIIKRTWRPPRISATDAKDGERYARLRWLRNEPR